MAEPQFDIVIVTDPRFQGGTSSAVAAEMSAAARAGYSVGFFSYEAANLRQPLPFNPRIKKLIDRGEVSHIVPGTRAACTLAILHNPFTAGLVPVAPLGITAERRLVVAHHPPVDADGHPSYEIADVTCNAEEILAGRADWVPVGPNARAAFASLPGAPALLPDDWANVIDLDAWRHLPAQRTRARIRIGRHSRPDLRKFPADRASFETIYGDGEAVDVDLLGCPHELRDLLHPVPAQWHLRPFGGVRVTDFLDGLDVFVYYHRPDWIEAFGYTVLEAMARGIPCVLPPTLAPSFGDAARIEAPETAFAAARALAEAPEPARSNGYDLVAQRHSFPSLARRLEALIGAPSNRRRSKPARASCPPAAMLISTNGIGMGHLTRTIAIARRLQEPIKPVLVTMSHGAEVAHEFGLHVEFIPYHKYLGTNVAAWNNALREELLALIDGFGARVVLFDGNSPFQGMIEALGARPDTWSVWSRRGMWRAEYGREFIERERHFDAVIEPSDLAAAFDTGPTTESRNLTRAVNPVRLLDAQELLPRAQARAELGVAPDATAILVQLGGGNNFDMRLSRDLALRALQGREGVQVVLVDWKISATAPPDDLPDNVLRLTTFPISRYLNGFDATISAAGYNSFHEATDAALPAIYIPNENPAQDDQLARASFAARRGAAILARRDRPEDLLAAVQRILDPETRQDMVAAAETLRRENGAVDAARIISHLAQTQRGARD